MRPEFNVLNAFFQHLSGVSIRPLNNLIGFGLQKIAVPLEKEHNHRGIIRIGSKKF